MADFVLRKISHRGTKHPVVARLVVQMMELLDFAKLDKSVGDDIKLACLHDLQSRLGKCWSIWEHLAKEEHKYAAEFKPSDARMVEVPHIDNLDREVENFLYEAKNFLRDLINKVIAPCFPDADLKDAKAFFDPKGKGDGVLVRWAEENFGADDVLTKFLNADQEWIGELVRKRNAIEHPGGYSGELDVHNFEVISDGRLVAPLWVRTGTEPEIITLGMKKYCHNLLTFAEEVIIFGCIEKNAKTKAITFTRISEHEINPECPVSFKAVFKEKPKCS